MTLFSAAHISTFVLKHARDAKALGTKRNICLVTVVQSKKERTKRRLTKFSGKGSCTRIFVRAIVFKTSVSVLGFEVTLIEMFKPGSYFTSILKCYIGSHSSLSGTWNVRHAICLVLPAQAIERFDPFSRRRKVLICILPFL